jgi:glycosyltransferase involved in cell wall biosynthesis
MIFAPRDLAIHLADGLVDKGHDVTFFTSEDTPTKAKIVPGDRSLLEKDYVKAMLEGRKSERLHWGYFYTLKHNYEIDLTTRCYEMAKSEKFDIIHSYHERLAHFFDQLTGMPTVYTLHDPLPEKEISLKYWLLDKYSHHNYVSISNSFRRNEKLHLNYIDTVYHGIPIDDVAVGHGQGGYLAFMGRLMQEKGAEFALEASQKVGMPIQLASSLMEVNVSDDEYYKNKILPHVNATTTTFLGFMDGAKKNEFLGGAKCFLFPIQWEEPFGMVMIEAMATGTPVVGYNRGSVAEIVKDGVTGFIIDPDDQNRPGKGTWVIKKQGLEGLVEAIRRIDEIDRKACRSHVETNFSVPAMVAGYEKVYERIIGRNKQPHN